MTANNREITKIEYNKGLVQINPSSGFDHVPENVWTLSIGSYQPAQKWLKDRAGMPLDDLEIDKYQKMIVALSRTIALTEELRAIDNSVII